MEKPKPNPIKDKLILAPMVRINTIPFRLLCKKYQCDITFTEEIIAKKLMNTERYFNKDLQTIDFFSSKDNCLVLRTLESEKDNLILQLGASNSNDAIKASEIVINDIIGIDLNMGCPKHFSTHGNMGSTLLNKPEIAEEILKNLKLKFKDKLISCKIRLLDNKEKFNNLIEKINNCNIDFFTIHLRYKDQNAKKPALWEKINDIKKIAKIPFVVNGDIFVPKDIQILKKLNPESGFMIGRGCIHNPKIFEEYKNTFEDLNLVSFQKDDNHNNLINENNDNNNLCLSDPNEKNIDDVKISVKLTNAIDKKYNGVTVDIIPLIKEYIELAIKYGNIFGNTKYVILSILKTHKKEISLFQKIQTIKYYDDLIKIFNMEDIYKKLINENPNLEKYLKLNKDNEKNDKE